MNNKNSVKTVVAVAIGAALFFVLGRFVAIPSGIPNTNISLHMRCSVCWRRCTARWRAA